MLILAGVSITALLGDDGIISKANDAANLMNEAIQSEKNEINALLNELDDIIIGNGGTDGDETPIDPTANWDLSKVTKVTSEDNVVVPVPIGFTKSTVEGEGSVATGFVIKQGSNGGATSGVNEFVWVPVEDPSEMFGTDSNGNSFGKLYGFNSGSPEPLNWTEIGWNNGGECREPDILELYDGSDGYDPSYFTSVIGNVTREAFKTQLQNEFEDMRDSVEIYGGFYIGRYETGNLSQGTAVVQKNNTDINNPNWYVQYQKCKTVVQESENIKGTTSMIWGCQWDATMKWFLKSSNSEVREYVTDSTGKGYYDSMLLMENGTGSNDDYKVNNIYDMAGNVGEWTLEGDAEHVRIFRRRLL